MSEQFGDQTDELVDSLHARHEQPERALVLVDEHELFARIEALNARVSRHLAARNEELAIEVGALRERARHQSERMDELRDDGEAVISEQATLRARVSELSEERAALLARLNELEGTVAWHREALLWSRDRRWWKFWKRA